MKVSTGASVAMQDTAEYQGRRLILALRAPISRSNRGKGQLRLIIFNEFSVRNEFLVRKW